MFIKSVYMNNFMSFTDALISFENYKGITLIEGVNGAGKSTILDAITWCLFGKLVRPSKKAKAEDVVHRFASKGRTVVIVELDINGRLISVERSRSKSGPNLRITGIDGASTTGGLQERLESIIGFDYSLFTSSVMFGGAVSSFCSMTDSEKKHLLECMLGFDRFLQARELLAKRQSSHLRLVEGKRNEVSSIKSNIDTYEEMLEGLTADAASFKREHKERLHTLREDNSVKVEEVEDAIDYLCKLRSVYQQTVEKYNAEFSKFEEAFSREDSKLKKLEDAIRSKENKLAETRGLLSSAKKQLEKAQPENHPDLCPTCGQRWPKDKLRAGLKTLLANLEKDVSTHENTCTALRKEIVSIEVKATEVRRRLKEISKSEPENPGSRDAFLSKAYAIFKDAVRANTFSLNLFAEEAARSKNPYEKRLKETKRHLKEVRDSFVEKKKELKEVEKESLLIEYWLKAFGKSGIPSYLLDSSIPQLNKSADEISEILTDNNLYVYFDPAQAKGKSSTFSVDIEFRNGGDTYDMVSKGEHSRVDLTVLFAIRDLIATQGTSSCSQVFVDELFDGLDSDGLEHVFSLLRKRYKDHQVFIISHNVELKGYCDQHLTVTKDNNSSKISE